MWSGTRSIVVASIAAMAVAIPAYREALPPAMFAEALPLEVAARNAVVLAGKAGFHMLFRDADNVWFALPRMC